MDNQSSCASLIHKFVLLHWSWSHIHILVSFSQTNSKETSVSFTFRNKSLPLFVSLKLYKLARWSKPQKALRKPQIHIINSSVCDFIAFIYCQWLKIRCIFWGIQLIQWTFICFFYILCTSSVRAANFLKLVLCGQTSSTANSVSKSHSLWRAFLLLWLIMCYLTI